MNRLAVSVSPHILSPVDTRHMMKGVIKALVPALIAGLYFYRLRGALVIMVSVASCVITEALLQKLRKRKVRIGDHSALLTGILLAMVLPPGIPLWMAFLGGVFAMSLGKEVFGGLGHNIFNPALLARAFLVATFPVALTTWNIPITFDAVTTATPLGMDMLSPAAPSMMSLFLGNVPGCIGESSALALLLGIAYLLYKKIIDHRIPVAYIGTVIVFAAITHIASPARYMGPLFHVMAGGLLLGAGFMATDPVTSPVTAKGRWLFGTGCGLITMTIRLWGGLPEGVMYSILLMNAATPLLDRVTAQRRFGVTRKKIRNDKETV